jgi:hypothetical protein
VAQAVDQQFGAVVFSSAEVVGTLGSGSQAWPASCSGAPADGDHTANELALEFLLFDAKSCIQNDGVGGIAP